MKSEITWFGKGMRLETVSSVWMEDREVLLGRVPKRQAQMSKNTKEIYLRPSVVPGFEPQFTANPMKVVRDKYGRLWLCRAEVDEDGDLEAQGAWRCGALTFTSIG